MITYLASKYKFVVLVRVESIRNLYLLTLIVYKVVDSFISQLVWLRCISQQPRTKIHNFCRQV